MPRHLDREFPVAIEHLIGHTFTKPELLQRALTHRSAATEHMERLEYLGDAVLGLVVAEYLHGQYGGAVEGELSRMRANLVCKASLQRVAALWQVPSNLNVGEGERTVDGVRSPSIAANAVEAIIGAVFIDAGWDAARHVVLKAWQPLLAGVGVSDSRDAKTRLQELTQGKGWGLPQYRIVDRGVGQSPRFEAGCTIRGEVVGRGRGERKQLAEMEAAEQAWKHLQE